MKWLSVFLISLFLISCATTKKQRGKAIKFFNEHPNEAAAFCGDNYPPTVTPGDTIREIDTLTVPGDSIPCPTYDPNTGKVDSTAKVVCPPSKIVKERVFVHDTIVNTAKEQALKFKLDSTSNLLIASRAETKTAELREQKAVKSSNGKTWIIIGLVGVIGLATFFRIKGIL